MSIRCSLEKAQQNVQRNTEALWLIPWDTCVQLLTEPKLSSVSPTTSERYSEKNALLPLWPVLKVWFYSIQLHRSEAFSTVLQSTVDFPVKNWKSTSFTPYNALPRYQVGVSDWQLIPTRKPSIPVAKSALASKPLNHTVPLEQTYSHCLAHVISSVRH